MRTIVAGCRDFNEYEILKSKLDSFRKKNHIEEIVSGGASGVDTLGEKYAKENDIPLTVFPADWKTHGKAAGILRNRQMADYAEQLIAVWDGESRGTKNMIEEMKKREKPTHVICFTRT